jgi:tyrosyl-tRNA synthetase
MPLLEGLDGVKKMSKSLDNYVGINDAPGEMYSKIVSMPDTLMWRYFELLSFRSMEEISQLRATMEAGANPRDVKIKLAEELVTRFHGQEAAANAHRSAGNRLKEGELPEDLPDVFLEADEEMPIAAVLNRAGMAKNAAAVRDLLNAGSVKVDGVVVDRDFVFSLDCDYVCQAGKKRFARIRIEKP